MACMLSAVHVVCGAGSDPVPVVEGKVFEITSIRPVDGFSCSNGYANHSQAMGLASLINKKIYTPYRSYKAVSIGSAELALGRSSYVLEGGVFNDDYTRMYNSYHTNGSAYEYPMLIQAGTGENLVPAKRSSNYYMMTRRYVDSNAVVNEKIANKACVIIPVKE